MTEEERAKAPAYIGRSPDGKVVAVTVDRRDNYTAEWVAGMIRDGLTVERTTCEWVRRFFGTDTPVSEIA